MASFQVLEHVSAPAEFLRDQLKALKSGGKLIIAVPSADTFLQHAVNNVFNMPPHHLTHWPDETLHYIAKQYDLTLHDVYHEPVQPIHFNWCLETRLLARVFKPNLLDTNMLRTALRKILRGLFKIMFACTPFKCHGRGHTVLAVYTKR